jgi:small subunit ribosomal protein S4
MKLFLKGTKCFSDKCPIEKRNFAPGQHGKDRKVENRGLRPAIARKAESQAHLLRPRRPVPQLFEKAARTKGRNRRTALATA